MRHSEQSRTTSAQQALIVRGTVLGLAALGSGAGRSRTTFCRTKQGTVAASTNHRMAMFATERIVLSLKEATRDADWIEDPYEWYANRRLPEPDVVRASVRLHFSEPPTASALAAVLQEVDRHARRTVTSFETGVPPSALFGRGVHLRPLADGLVVEQAREGSLEVVLLLGALYGAITSQPLSFALNLASLLEYSQVVVRSLLPDGKQRSKELRVAPTHRPQGSTDEAWSADTIEIPTPHGIIRVPAHFEHVRCDYESPDGSKLTVEAGPDRDSSPVQRGGRHEG